MKRAARLQVENVLRAFLLMLFLLTVAWVVISFLVFGDILVGQPLVILNLVLAAVLGVFFYRSRYHEVLEWDEEGFRLRRGAKSMTGRWADFCAVGLTHVGRGIFAVRLYRDQELRDCLELPVARLGLNPQSFRDQVTARVVATRAEPREAGGAEEAGEVASDEQSPET